MGTGWAEEPHPEHTQGTVVIMIIIAAYTLIHHSMTHSNLQKVRFAAFVLMSLRLWRVHVKHTKGLTAADGKPTCRRISPLVHDMSWEKGSRQSQKRGRQKFPPPSI